MNSLQIELDSINQQLELLTYRKTQLDSIMAEYSDVVNRVKSLVELIEDVNGFRVQQHTSNLTKLYPKRDLGQGNRT